MKFPWRSDKGKLAASEATDADYTSEAVVESRVVPGVTFTIAKMSFGRRVELMRRVRELARRTEFLAASGDAGDKMDAALLQAEIERMYVMWGVKAVSGLVVDGTRGGPGTAGGSGAGGVVPRGTGGGAQRDRAERRRKKKLLVAFHFQFSNQAGWECDACRRSGLEIRRRCGWLGLPTRRHGRAGLGAEDCRNRKLPEVLHHGGERGDGGGLPGATPARRDDLRRVERAAGGGIPDSGAGASGGGSDGEQNGEHEMARAAQYEGYQKFLRRTHSHGEHNTRRALPDVFGGVGQQASAIEDATSMLADVIAQIGERTEQCRGAGSGYHVAGYDATTDRTAGALSAGSIASTVLKSGFGLAPLIGGLVSLFSGGERTTPPPLVKYAMPAAIDFQAAQSTGESPIWTTTRAGMARSSMQTGERNAWDRTANGAAPQITVNVQAMDARSFLDRSSDIALAVRDAMLNLNSINDVVNEL